MRKRRVSGSSRGRRQKGSWDPLSVPLLQGPLKWLLVRGGFKGTQLPKGSISGLLPAQLPHHSPPRAFGHAWGLPVCGRTSFVDSSCCWVAGQKRRKGGQGRRENANRNPSRKESKEVGTGSRRRKGQQQQQQQQGTVGPLTSAGPT